MPPLARMEAVGVETMVGTDNAMLFPPDIMPEIDAFAELARTQGCSGDMVARASVRARKLLRESMPLGVSVGDAAAAVPGETVTVIGKTS